MNNIYIIQPYKLKGVYLFPLENLICFEIVWKKRLM